MDDLKDARYVLERCHGLIPSMGYGSAMVLRHRVITTFPYAGAHTFMTKLTAQSSTIAAQDEDWVH